MSNLKDILANFQPELGIKAMNNQFIGLAKSFLYDGYIVVNDTNKERYRIYIRTVEFYCHYEGKTTENESWRKDWIVYHRNNHYIEGEIPYFPIMSFHAHASGYDITFENEKLKLRSSALIRAYEVYDVTKGCFLVCRKMKDEKGNECIKFIRHSEGKRYNTQSTYLYNFLNGFIGNSVEWKDEDISTTSEKRVTSKHRQNVYKYNNKGVKQLDLDKDRQWSFTREDEIKIPKQTN